jgi:hypothetical protein
MIATMIFNGTPYSRWQRSAAAFLAEEPAAFGHRRSLTEDRLVVRERVLGEEGGGSL